MNLAFYSLFFLGQVSFLTFFYLFPSGRFVPRWSWVLVGLWIIQDYFFSAPPDSPFFIGKWPPLLEHIRHKCAP